MMLGIGEAPISPVDNAVWTLEEEPRLNSILMMGDYAGERLALEILFRYWSCKLVMAYLDVAAMNCCNALLQKTGS